MAAIDDGDWLSTPGPYLDLIESLYAADPSLRKPLGLPKNPKYTPRVVGLEVRGDDARRVLQTEDCAALRTHFEQINSTADQGRKMIYLVEGFSPQLTDVLGTQFMMHPSFFARQRYPLEFPPFQPGLPSDITAKGYISLQYPEWLCSRELPPRDSYACADTGRWIILQGIEYDRTLRRDVQTLSRLCTCSVWKSPETSEGGWNVVILSDPLLRRATAPGSGVVHISTQAFEGGYTDIMPSDLQMMSATGPPRTSMLDDLCHYLETHYRHFQSGRRTAEVFLYGIVARHYATCMDWEHYGLWGVQHSIGTHQNLSAFSTAELETHWCSAQRIFTSLNDLALVLDYAISQIEILGRGGDHSTSNTWNDIAADFRHLRGVLQSLIARADSSLNSITGLASISGNQQTLEDRKLALQAADRSVREARRARVLVLVGLVFIPLSLVSSLFSMAEPYGPGQHQFWVYFAVAVPFVIAVVGMYWVFDIGFSHENERWSVENFKARIAEKRPIKAPIGNAGRSSAISTKGTFRY